MNEFINTSAVTLTFVVAISLPFLTLLEVLKSEDAERKVKGIYHGSVLELSVNTKGYEPKQLEKIENVNIEMNGMLRVYSSSLP